MSSPPDVPAEVLAFFREKYADLRAKLRETQDFQHRLIQRKMRLREQLDAIQQAASAMGISWAALSERPPGASAPEAQQHSLLPPEPPAGQATNPTGSIREIVLDRLREVYPEGMKAAEVRAYLKSTHGIETHEKTAGMTLYRLLKSGLARRDGITWFSAPETEKENPGGQAGVQ